METIFTYQPDKVILEKIGISEDNESDYIKHTKEVSPEGFAEMAILNDLAFFFELTNNHKESNRIERILEGLGAFPTEGLE